MSVTVTVNAISIDGNGVVRVRFGKDEREFASVAAMQAWVASVLDKMELKAVALALMLARQPTLSNPNAFVGHSMTVDFTINNWGALA